MREFLSSFILHNSSSSLFNGLGYSAIQINLSTTSQRNITIENDVEDELWADEVQSESLEIGTQLTVHFGMAQIMFNLLILVVNVAKCWEIGFVTVVDYFLLIHSIEITSMM